MLRQIKWKQHTLCSVYKEFGYKEHPATRSRFLCTMIFDRNVEQFSYNEHSLRTNSFLCVTLLVVSGTQCKLHFLSCNFVHTFFGAKKMEKCNNKFNTLVFVTFLLPMAEKCDKSKIFKWLSHSNSSTNNTAILSLQSTKTAQHFLTIQNNTKQWIKGNLVNLPEFTCRENEIVSVVHLGNLQFKTFPNFELKVY